MQAALLRGLHFAFFGDSVLGVGWEPAKRNSLPRSNATLRELRHVF
jgi:hypothetical protein